jgi:8-oxo-dGTP pyrophosphatase MutT (NUDIX family)
MSTTAKRRLDAARREAAEEVGVVLQHLEPVGQVYSSPGAMTERIDLFLGEYTSADRQSAGGGLAHEGEEIEVLELPLARLCVRPARRRRPGRQDAASGAGPHVAPRRTFCVTSSQRAGAALRSHSGDFPENPRILQCR